MPKREVSRELFSSKIFRVKEVEVEFDKGQKLLAQYVEKADTAMIVPLTDDGQVIFVKEYFVALNEYQLCLPKGRVELGLDPLTTANKELQEEIGYKAGRLDPLFTICMAPGYYTQQTHLFLARNLVESRLPGDEAESLGVVFHPLERFEEKIEQKQLREGRAITALYLARRFLGKDY